MALFLLSGVYQKCLWHSLTLFELIVNHLNSGNWREVYSTSEHDLINDFFRPALASSVRYDRGVGFFSSSWVREAAEGLAEFACNDGKARWVTSPILDKRDWAALSDGTENQVNSILAEGISKNVEAIKNEIIRETLSALAWMVSDGILEFKLACPRNKLSGDFHSKYGIFYDNKGDRLCFNGSYNDNAWAHQRRNYIRLSVLGTCLGEIRQKLRGAV